MSEPLKNCPFCNDEAHVEYNGPTAEQIAHTISWAEDYDVSFWVQCPGCNSTGPLCQTEDEAIAAWNRRTPSPAVDAGRGQHVIIDHDDFAGDIIGSYCTREGKLGVVVQQDDTRVVHVYGRKWVEGQLAASDRFNTSAEHVIETAKTEQVREGWVLVPREPTGAMIRAGVDERDRPGSGAGVAKIYRAMLAASPPSTGDKE